LANQQNTSGSPIFSELHCICGAEWEWRNRDWELVTTPPQRKPLTDEEMQSIIYEYTKLNPNQRDDKQLIGYIINATRAIEAAHGIKGEA